ncbi:MAG: gamma-glutamylcyclotransferase family protein [Pseudomonadota bacterium]
MARKVNGFFYGLFMDPEVLREKRINGIDARPALVTGYALKIGERATMVAQSDSTVYGMVIALGHPDLEILYGSQGLDLYKPEAVLAQLLDGPAVPALCYNLIEPPNEGESNSRYAASLREVLTKFGFPEQYVASIN